MKNQTKYVALYERLSHDDEQLGESNSISNQKEMLEEYVRSRGITNYRHFTDDGISGTRFDRPGFLAMMEQVKQGNISQICIKDMSRMGRDYLQVGQLMEMLRQKGVMLVAINDGVDTSKGDDDFVPFRNIMNEWYAKDTSKKIKSVFQAKGRSGKHVASSPPYGYFKSEDDPNQWIVDQEAAKVIRRIFQMILDGLGPYQITQVLKNEKVPIPAMHMNKLGIGNHRGREIKDPYNWSSATVVGILERREYLGHTVNFKTRKHFKDSHSRYVDEDLWVFFEDTQEPIIDQETFDLVQKIRANVTRWPDGWGPAHSLTGLVYCADCGGKLYCHRTDNGKPAAKYSCGNYPKKKCSSGHRIDGDDLLKTVGETLKAVHDYIQVDNSQFVRSVEQALTSQQTQDVKSQKKRLAECQCRAQELETLLCKIYEDNILGKLPDKRYEMLSNQYERENAALEQEIRVLTASIENYTDGTSEAKKFMGLIGKYQDFENLTPAMLNELIDKIVVHERDRKGSRQTTQRIDIYFSFIGNFVPPAPPVDPEIAAAQEEERRKIEERKDRLHQNYLRRKTSGEQQKWEERYKPVRQERMKKQRAEVDAISPKMSRTQYYDMRTVTRTEADMPEGMIGYNAKEVVRRATVV
jgi:DNA invertase Pin-like site-specific DNA recombinase